MRTILLLIVLSCSGSLLLAQDHELGDLVEGGIVFYISAHKDTLLTSAIRDQGMGLSWLEAKERCEKTFSIQGSQLYWGWRLPNKREVQIMRHLRDLISEAAVKANGTAFDNSVSSYYWSSTEISTSYAWLMPFGFDQIKQMTKGSNLFNARGVRTILLKEGKDK